LKTKNLRDEEHYYLARDVLLAADHPLRLDDLYQAVVERGAVIRGKDPKTNFRVGLWRRRSAFPFENGTYSVAVF
jgi:hypothetical protein